MKIAVLAGPGDSTHLLVNALRQHPDVTELLILVEESVSPRTLFAGRVRRLGWRTALGQLAFIVLISRFQRLLSRTRIHQIIEENGLTISADYPATHVPSVNDLRVTEMLDAFSPDLITVNGTRIITRRTLKRMTAPLINIHAGYTPDYRGVHGGYWALANGEPDRVGTTVHFVDAGIDTGAPIRRELFRVTRRDNFSTYPYLHSAAGIRALQSELASYSATRKFGTATPSEKSRLYYHPTLGRYLMNWFQRGIR